MMEIKFRGKEVATRKWVYGDLIHGVGSKAGKMFILPVKHIYPPGCNELDGWNVVPETVGQFTGLLDKNGKDVFLGDILHERYEDKYEEDGYHDYYNEVVFVNGSFGIIGEVTGELLPFSEYPITNQCIVGNIYDNPELTKEQEEEI